MPPSLLWAFPLGTRAVCPPPGVLSIPSFSVRAPPLAQPAPPPSLQVTLPVYLNFTRADLIFTVDFEIATKEDPRSFYEQGVAVLCTK